MNLLEETNYILKEHGKTIHDIEWVGDRNLEISIEQFVKLADVEYDNGYGGEEVYVELLVVGSNWWLERHQYDGSEWWEFKTLPTRPGKIGNVLKIVGDVNYEGLQII